MKHWKHYWVSFGLEMPYHYGRDDNRWMKVVEKATGRVVFSAPLFMGFWAEHYCMRICAQLNMCTKISAEMKDLLDTIP